MGAVLSTPRRTGNHKYTNQFGNYLGQKQVFFLARNPKSIRFVIVCVRVRDPVEEVQPASGCRTKIVSAAVRKAGAGVL